MNERETSLPRIAELRVVAGAGAPATCTLRLEGEADFSGAIPAEEVARIREAAAQGRGWGPGVLGGGSDPRRGHSAATLVPGAVGRRLRKWAMSGMGGGGVGRLLCVACDESDLWGMSWEALPSALGLGSLPVARLAGAGAPRASTPYGGRWSAQRGLPAALVAGWSQAGEAALPGVTRELSELPPLLGSGQRGGPRLEVTALPEPTAEELQAAWRGGAPALIHLSHPGATPAPEGNGLALLVPDASCTLRPLRWAEMSGPEGPRGLSLVVLSAPGAGLEPARALCQELGAVVVGWPLAVTDADAADFALFFYQRLLEELSPAAALEMYRRSARVGARDDAPVIWLPVTSAARWSPLAESVLEGLPPQPVTRSSYNPMRGGGTEPSDGGRRKAGTQIDFEPLSVINPALLLNGQSPIARLSVSSPEAQEGVRLRVTCDAGGSASVYRQTFDLQEGVQPLNVSDARFPVLYDLIRTSAARRYLNLGVRLTAGDKVLDETTRAVLWMGLDEWMDEEQTWPFIPAFVQPNRSSVRKVIDQGSARLGVQEGAPVKAFSGYLQRSPEAVKYQMRILFSTLHEEPFKLQYIGPPAPSVFEPGAKKSKGQRVRLADEVLEHRRGTCHDLSLLFASCAENIGIHPVVILIHGHTFSGFWTSAQAKSRFWETSAMAQRDTTFGAGWVIRRTTDLKNLVERGDIEVFEATKVTEPTADYETARSQAVRLVQSLGGQGLDAAIDVCAARHAVEAM